MKRLLGFAALFVLAAVVNACVRAERCIPRHMEIESCQIERHQPPAPKELIRKVESDGDSVKYTYTGTAADGQKDFLRLHREV